MMQKLLILPLLALSLTVFGQRAQIYIEFDPTVIDKLDYKFVDAANDVSYTTYRINKDAVEKIYLEMGLEQTFEKKTLPTKVVSAATANLDYNDVASINAGQLAVYLCRKVAEGWSVSKVSAASHLSFADNLLNYQASNFDLQLDILNLSNEDLSRHTDYSPAAVYYVSNIDACGKGAYYLKHTPRVACSEETYVTIAPEIGVIQENITHTGQIYELVAINNNPTCEYLTGSTPTLASVEATPESYSTVVTEKAVTNENVAVTSTEFTTPPPTEIVEETCTEIAAEGEYIVMTGDNLFGIARRYGLTVAQLREWNTLQGDLIYPCTHLKIAAQIVVQEKKVVEEVPTTYAAVAVKKVETVVCTNKAGEGEYVVQKGETLYGISRKSNVKLDDLKAWNSLKSDRIMPCQKLLIVAPKTTAKTVKEVRTADPEPVKSYSTVAVKKVETTTKVVVKKGTGLHIVEKGETVASLAKRFEISEEDFRKINFLSAKETLGIGQVVRIQNCACPADLQPLSRAQIEAEIPSTYSTVAVKKSGDSHDLSEVVTSKSVETETVARKYHVVQDGETLTSIAKKYGITVEKLRSANEFSAQDLILPQQLLRLE